MKSFKIVGINIFISRVLVLAICFVTVIGSFIENIYAEGEFEPVNIDVSAESAVLIEASNGAIIYSKNADVRMPMASTTKIMTALVAIESGNIEREVTVSAEAVGVEGSSVYLYVGEKLKLSDLIYALMLESANDAAAAIAVELGGSIEGFADMMNDKAKQIGLEGTHFTNPHGLHSEEHYTTARDLALLTVYALENPDFLSIVSTYKKVIPLKGGEGARVLINHNKLLKQYEGCIGVKTGFTKKSGRCLVSAAERDGIRLIAVTLNAPDDWNDHKHMLDYGFSEYECVKLVSRGELTLKLPVVNGVFDFVIAENCRDLYVTLKKELHDIECRFELKRFYYAPVIKNQTMGKAIFYNHGEYIGSVDIITIYGVGTANAASKSLYDKIFGLLKIRT